MRLFWNTTSISGNKIAPCNTPIICPTSNTTKTALPTLEKKPKQATPTKVWFQIDFISISTNQWVEIKACNYKLHIWLIRTGHAWSLSWMPHSLFSFLEEDPGSLSLFRLYIGQSPSYLMCGLGARVSILGILTHLHEWAHSTREKMETYSTSRMEKQPWCSYVTILSLATEWLTLLGLLGQGGESPTSSLPALEGRVWLTGGALLGLGPEGTAWIYT